MCCLKAALCLRIKIVFIVINVWVVEYLMLLHWRAEFPWKRKNNVKVRNLMRVFFANRNAAGFTTLKKSELKIQRCIVELQKYMLINDAAFYDPTMSRASVAIVIANCRSRFPVRLSVALLATADCKRRNKTYEFNAP